MPHKHKRRQNDESTYDLPPSLIAKSLPVRDPSKPSGKDKFNGKQKSKRTGNPNAKPKSQPHATDGKAPAPKPNEKAIAATSRRKSALEDDTPRAFRQLMQFQERRQTQQSKKRRRDGDGSDSDSGSESDTPVVPRKNKNKKQSVTTTTKPEEVETKTVAPKILPGEKLADFAARVDREMPLADMKRSNKPTSNDLPKIREQRTTKHEKHLKRLQSQWREDDARIKEREAAEREERQEEMEEQLQLWKDWEVEAGKKKRNPNHSGGAKKRKGGEDDDGPDPWAKLKKKRAGVNPFEVAQEPPQLKKPREIFKVRGGAKVDVANVPASVGSLRRREELANERRNIVEEYRRLMAEKRGA
ncbi:uncharacterized protein DSM5745_05471 [Aspergillus mulundensis]|uniref:Urease accessory protein UreD n=1 Tax=Aspergillus mulundensis TaxID=1810919 RepID=A0A3D8RX26_9EURO|nr:Uncharacterized protein DSM5745_05471 [Aspergillus mulundensis]RDW78619.1 Uncharacterized protein DSM5745_05471 [Aspergillus mulundensis]